MDTPCPPDASPGAPLSAERQEEFVRLLNGAHGRLLRFVVSLVARRHDAEDILQKASVTMWRRFADFKSGTDFVAWACTVAAYEVKNFQRSLGRSRVLFDDELVEVLAAERIADLKQYDARLDALEECVKKLDDSSRLLVDAIYTRGEEIKEFARKEGRAPQTLYNRLNLIRKLLTECMHKKLAPAAS